MMKVLRKKRKGGFTLIELIVVIAILGILAAIAIPRFQGIRDTSTVKADAATAAQIVNAARIQETETGTTLANLAALNATYMVPGTPQNGPSFTLTGGGAAAYVVTWTPASGTHSGKLQTVTENVKFVINP